MQSEQLFLKIGFSLLTAIFVPLIAYYILDKLDQRNNKNIDDGKKRLKKIFNKNELDDLNIYEYEIASCISYKDEEVSWKDIGGLTDIVNDILKKVVFPFQYFHLLNTNSPLIKASKGVLLHGHPGCGKTMLVKALATELDCPLILLDLSIITDKFYGETEKLVKAVFSLARKIQPCIIFIDEIDCLLRTRNASDHEVTSRVKSIFLTQMDGFLTQAKDLRVLLIGATNRIDSLDQAILRRLPERFYIPLPDQDQRVHILKTLLEDIPVSNDLDLVSIAVMCDKFSGSDLKELCRTAVSLSIYNSSPPDQVTLKDQSSQSNKNAQQPVVHFKLSHSDFMEALSTNVNYSCNTNF